jgi:dCMP deaminase
MEYAEQNALLNCSKEQAMRADLYLASVNPDDYIVHKAKQCPLCARLIIQAGIENVIIRTGEREEEYVVILAKKLVWHN